MFLQRGDREIALEQSNFLRGMEEFEGVPSRNQIRSLENDVFLESLDCRGETVRWLSDSDFLQGLE